MDKKKIGFFIGHGIEVRHFILSGLFDSARKENIVTILMHEDVKSIFLNDYVDSSQIQYLNEISVKKRHWFEGYVSVVRKARLRLKEVGNFHNFNEGAQTYWLRDILLGNIVTHTLISLIATRILKKHYTDNDLSNYFKVKGFSMIFLLDYNIPFHLQIGYSANKAEVAVRIIINTPKSFYVNDFIPFHIDQIFTWNEKQNLLFRKSNLHLPAKSFCAIGSPYHHFLLPSSEPKFFDKEIEFLDTQPFILYSLIFEKVYDAEFEILKIINSFLNENFQEKRPKIVIRRNPFEESNFNIEVFKTLNNVIIAPHYWERNVKKGWSIQAYKGEVEWRYLLSKARLLINITSMASIEAILSGTPVINIGFNGLGIEEIRLKRFNKAPFLDDILSSNYVKQALKFDDFKRMFFEFYNIKSTTSKKSIQESIQLKYVNDSKIQQIIKR